MATNAVLTDRLARAVLVTTEGFRDTLSYRGGSRPDLYSLAPHRPSELVPRRDRIEAHEEGLALPDHDTGRRGGPGAAAGRQDAQRVRIEDLEVQAALNAG